MIKKKLNNIDFIRSIAVLFVLSSHLIGKYPASGLYHVQTLGILGVVIFFTLTTFILIFSLKRINRNKIYIINNKFYIERIFRIYPLSIFMVIIYFTIQFKTSETFNLKFFLSNIFLIQVLNKSGSLPASLWTLSYEVLSYAFLPFVFLIIIKKTLKEIYYFFGYFLLSLFLLQNILIKNFFK